jgi:hypothetical protein
MKQLRIHIISLIAILIPYLGYTQDSLEVNQSNFALNLYADVGKGVESLFNKQTKWEFGVSVLASQKFLFSGEYGYGQLNPQSVINNGSYTSEGNYYRAGFEYVYTIVPRTSLSTGIMFAYSDFSDYGNVQIESDLWNNIDETFERADLTASWLEWIVNTETPLTKVDKGFFGNFYWGLRIRIRILISDINQPDFDIYAIPGYGKTYSNVVPAVNLYLKYRIDF